MNPEQSDLGPYWLKNRLPKYKKKAERADENYQEWPERGIFVLSNQTFAPHSGYIINFSHAEKFCLLLIHSKIFKKEFQEYF